MVCAIWGLYWHASSTIRAYASPCRTSSETRGRRTASHALSDAAYQRIPSDMTSAVSLQLSHSDLVQLPIFFHFWVAECMREPSARLLGVATMKEIIL